MFLGFWFGTWFLWAFEFGFGAWFLWVFGYGLKPKP